jgi:hypothetical protein
MKSILVAGVAALIGVPAISLACQTNAPMTRAQVRAELVQLENAGYYPSASKLHYPDDIQAAQARVTAKNDTAHDPSTCGTLQASGPVQSK